MRDRWSLTRWPTYSPRHSQFVLSVLHLRGRETATFALFLYRVRYFGPSSGDNSVFGNCCPLLAFTHSQITTKPILFLTLHNLKGETASFHSERVCVLCVLVALRLSLQFSGQSSLTKMLACLSAEQRTF